MYSISLPTYLPHDLSTYQPPSYLPLSFSTYSSTYVPLYHLLISLSTTYISLSLLLLLVLSFHGGDELAASLSLPPTPFPPYLSPSFYYLSYRFMAVAMRRLRHWAKVNNACTSGGTHTDTGSGPDTGSIGLAVSPFCKEHPFSFTLVVPAFCT